MLNNWNLNPGDILMITPPKMSLKPATWLSNGIALFMKLYLRTNGERKKFKTFLKLNGLPEDTIVTHSAMVYESWGILKVSEALGKGATCQPFINAYPKEKHDRLLVLRPKIAYIPEQVKTLGHVCEATSLVPTPYHRANFLWHIIYITTRKWLGRKGPKSELRQFCIQLTANQANESSIFKPFKDTYKLNPVQMLTSKFYSVEPFKSS